MNNDSSNINASRNMPIGLAMALSQDFDAMQAFASLGAEEQRGLLEKARRVKSKSEMKAIVESLSDSHSHTIG